MHLYVHVYTCMHMYINCTVYNVHDTCTCSYRLAMLIRLGRCGLESDVSFNSLFKSDPCTFSGNSFIILQTSTRPIVTNDNNRSIVVNK